MASAASKGDSTAARRRVRILVVLVCLLMYGAGAGLAALRHLVTELPSIAQLEGWIPKQTTRVFAADSTLLYNFAVERRTWVPLSRIPDNVVKAFLAIEDRRFYEHGPFDWPRIGGALVEDLKTLSLKEGGSTITQQLARTIFLTPQKTIPRKLKEAILAVELERSYTKDEILELYLNQIYFGSGSYGVEAAAQAFFGKSVRTLTPPEAALIAGLPPAPARYSPLVNRDLAIERRNTVLKAMAEVGYITPEESEEARATELVLRDKKADSRLGAYFVEHVRRLLQEQFGSEAIYQQGLKVYTTLNPRLQALAEEVLEAQLDSIEADPSYHHLSKKHYEQLPEPAAGWRYDPTRRTPYLQGALVAIDPATGDVLALVGGRDYHDSKFNRAIQARRQPGSIFKPFVYTAAIDNGIPPSYVLRDSPITLLQPDSTLWQPTNFDERFRGPVVLREGLRHSINLVAIKLLQQVGATSVVQYAHRMGIESPLPAVQSLAIGSAGVTPLEVVRAYSTFASLGERITPRFITRVEDSQGRVLLETAVQRERVLDEQSAYLMVDLLQDVVNRGTGARARRLGFARPAGGKTGSTNDFTDAWFVGFTPQLVAGVWVGFDEPRTIMPQGVGARLALPAWTEFMKGALEGQPVEEFLAPPSGLTSRSVCRVSGLIPTTFCPVEDIYQELFLEGTEPTRECDVHGPAELLIGSASFPPASLTPGRSTG